MKRTTKLFTLLTLCALLPTTAYANSNSYVVAAGDTLSKIARDHQTTVSQLMQANQLHTDQLAIGQKLDVPMVTTNSAPKTTTSSPASIEPQTPPVNLPVIQSSQEVVGGQKARVAVDALNIRQEPSMDSTIIGKLSRGAMVDVIATNSEWAQIKHGSSVAYVNHSFLQATGQPIPDFSGGAEVKSERLDRMNTIVQPLLATPYRLGGTTPTSGFDCSGFTSYVFDQLGVKLPRTSHEQFLSGQEVDLKDIQPGDLIFYDSLGTGNVSHVAIYTGNGEIVHANGEDVRYGKVEYLHKLYPFYGVKRYIDFEG
ncbi:C40 family peptidase [Brevibacillus daliensis]|uniref:C40 family peptidase n=1 Tax=Brevibacillus daliensis TaxID=2892995 RepID=UPI001E571803|nr:NlpC/P60 family protein [Brevibacillus daliensis]